MLATDLLATSPSVVEIDGRDLPELDITDAAALEAAVEEAKPQWIINCAAYTAVDRAEQETAVATAVNGTALGTIGRIARQRGIRVAHISTDYVFDGMSVTPYREDDPVSPVNTYGATKLEGERQLIASGAEYLLVRTQWLYGRSGKSFPRTMLDRARAGQTTRVVSDQTGRLTNTVDLANGIWKLIAFGHLGVFHAANEGVVTWYDVARRVFERCGTPDAVSPCTTAEYPTPARRPRYSVLDTTKLEQALGSGLPRWDVTLDNFLAESAAKL